MNIEDIRADIFRLFDIKIDKDDPIWAFLYANRSIMQELKDIIEVSEKETKQHHKDLKSELNEFKKTAKDLLNRSIEQFELRIDEFDNDIKRLEKLSEDSVNMKNRFKTEIRKVYDENIDHMSGLFDSNIIALEDRITSIIEAVDYTRFSKNIETEVQDIVKKSLQEVRAGVSINRKAMDNLNEINERNESTIRKLNTQVSTLTTLGIFQTLLLGASVTFIAMIYLSQGTLRFSTVEKPFSIEKTYILNER